MKIEVYSFESIKVAHVISEDIVIASVQDALDLMGDLYFRGISKIIIYESNIIPEFFDLKTGVAGEILQKFSTYNAQLAIVGNFDKYQSKSLRDFIFESNKTGRINFVGSLEEAKEKMLGIKQFGKNYSPSP
jgi:GTPase SAR1 family protein